MPSKKLSIYTILCNQRLKFNKQGIRISPLFDTRSLADARSHYTEMCRIPQPEQILVSCIGCKHYNRETALSFPCDMLVPKIKRCSHRRGGSKILRSLKSIRRLHCRRFWHAFASCELRTPITDIVRIDISTHYRSRRARSRSLRRKYRWGKILRARYGQLLGRSDTMRQGPRQSALTRGILLPWNA